MQPDNREYIKYLTYAEIYMNDLIFDDQYEELKSYLQNNSDRYIIVTKKHKTEEDLARDPADGPFVVTETYDALVDAFAMERYHLINLILSYPHCITPTAMEEIVKLAKMYEAEQFINWNLL